MHQNDVKLIIHVHKHQTRKGQYRIKKICVDFPFFWLSWILNFSFPVTASVHTYLVNPAYESALQSGNFWIRYGGIRNRVKAKFGYFIRWRNKVETVCYREYCICIQDGSLIPRISLTRFTTHALLPLFPEESCAQGPEEMCLSLEHQNPSKTSEKMGYFDRVDDRVTVSLHILFTANQETDGSQDRLTVFIKIPLG